MPEIILRGGEGMDTRASAELACILEATARKPGNAHVARDLDGLSYLELLKSAVAIGPVLADVRARGIGATILDAVIATRQAVSTNTNLGIILLLVPMAHLADHGLSLNNLAEEIAALDVSATKDVYEAIRLAKPGGMKKVSDQDLEETPTLGLLAVMRLAEERDTIARQYARGFADVREMGIPALLESLAIGHSLEEAICLCHLAWMAQFPDSLIARKRGELEARESSARARGLLTALSGQRGFLIDPALRRFDEWLTAKGMSRNPGTSADLVTACLFWTLRTGAIDAERHSFSQGDERGVSPD